MTVINCNQGAYGIVGMDSDTVGGVRVDVDDQKVQANVPGFNGLERAFALFPYEEDGKVAWKRVELTYDRKQSCSGDDVHGFWITRKDINSPWLTPAGEKIDFQAANKYGVAFGLDTNVGTVWLQGPDDNAFPRGP